MSEEVVRVVFLAMGVVGTLSGVAGGVWMMVSPASFERWRFRGYWNVTEPDPTITGRRSKDIAARIAGAILTVVSLFFLFLIASVIWQGTPMAPLSPREAASRSPRFDWGLLFIGLLLTTCGIYTIAAPGRVTQWVTRMAMSRRIPASAIPTVASTMRVIGAIVVLVGLQTLYWWYRLLG